MLIDKTVSENPFNWIESFVAVIVIEKTKKVQLKLKSFLSQLMCWYKTST